MYLKQKLAWREKYMCYILKYYMYITEMLLIFETEFNLHTVDSRV